MDQLVTIIGNAAVDPNFRKRFLDNPVDTVDHYRFVLTKGDFEIMQTVFVNLSQEAKNQLEEAFSALQEKLYAPLNCGAPCYHSINPPPEFRERSLKAA